MEIIWNKFHDKVPYSWFPKERTMVLVSKNKQVFCAQLFSGINGYWWADISDKFITNFEGTDGWQPYPDPI